MIFFLASLYNAGLGKLPAGAALESFARLVDLGEVDSERCLIVSS